MTVMRMLRSLGPIDLRGVGRDQLISWMAFFPLLIALIIRSGIPPLTTRLLESYAFDLTPYYPMILAYFLLVMSPMVLGLVIGFLLLDEKDDRTLTALQVTPLPLSLYVIYRVAVPFILTFILMIVVFPLSGLVVLSIPQLLFTALIAAPLAPLFAMLLAAVADNKVAGFALTKTIGAVLILPVVTYFIDVRWEVAFGIIPTYWTMKAYWLMASGEPLVMLYSAAAVIYPLLLTVFLVRRFNRVMRQ